MNQDLSVYRDGSTEPWVVDILCALIRAMKPSVIVETGTFKGLTTLKFLEASLTYQTEREAIVISIENDAERAAAANTMFRSMNLGGHIMLVTGPAEGFLAHYRGGVDFIFLDDDHTAEHVREEIRLGLKLLRPGGLLCGHDVVGDFGLGDVFREVGGVVIPTPLMHLAGGIGIVVKK